MLYSENVRQAELKWEGDLNSRAVRALWEPEVNSKFQAQYSCRYSLSVSHPDASIVVSLLQ